MKWEDHILTGGFSVPIIVLNYFHRINQTTCTGMKVGVLASKLQLFYRLDETIFNILHSVAQQSGIVAKFSMHTCLPRGIRSDGQTPWLNGRPSDIDNISDHWSKFRNIVIFRKKFRKGLNQNIDQKATFGRNLPKGVIIGEKK